ncbi:acetyl-CoA C-acetyltransferase [Nocardia beijingensis]|uniref:acetyl-CoA C-acetyltransferase n=1 Tax=Nocardia beijingensis TaxID=95162 RepID=UPI001893EDE0|nr:acetyl-CoA C-acetyltransferase [Nocardia beijingensis]MBF6468325.1 acetyl-CoA C-acetyltransferase [Nocardia beijingensis]
MPEAVIVSVARSPIGRAGKGSLRDLRPDDLGAQIVRAALAKVPALGPNGIDDLMLGCGQPAGESGFNLARVVAILAGLDRVPGTTGVETVSRYDRGSADGMPGTENPAFADAVRRTGKFAAGGEAWTDPRTEDLLPDVYIAMGQTAENVAQLCDVSRAEQDAFGVRSQNLAEAAIANGFWERDITAITLPDGSVVSKDDGPRPGVTLEKVAELKPVFRPDGTVTAANCCPLNDGAAAVVIMSDAKAAELGLTPLARIVATGVSALSPEIMGLGPVEASKQALARAGMTIDDVDLVEINEAFAAQVIPSARELGVDFDKLNINGGSIAVGHPFGMTGARITSTLINSLQFHDKQIGLETMCVGGGQGMAMVLERLS